MISGRDGLDMAPLAAMLEGSGAAARLRHATADLAALGENNRRVAALAQTHGEKLRNTHGARFERVSADLAEARKALTGESLAAAWQAYAVDAVQRSILFLDVLRERGNAYIAHEAAGSPPVLDFRYETLVDGRSLPRPVNYSLVRIIPPDGVTVNDDAQPFVIVDPRAGHGAGIGGFKPDSQVGVALAEGHPCYFVVFRPWPEPGQTLSDVTAAEETFLKVIRARHPNASRPIVIGNCQGGWATMLLAASAPDETGPVVLNGAPLSYWAGSNGKNPMRYQGGLMGGALPALIMSDLTNGVFDGANLVQNFENLNPANTYWNKYYTLYSRIDTEAPRFLEFERWWGGFFFMNEAEIRWIVENLFIGNKLGRGHARLGDKLVDLKAITQPVLVFASSGDNITPPQQALNWIADVYGNVLEIKALGRKIVYMVHEDIGHLGIFVSGKIAKREHAEIADTLQAIEALPPGLYEMVIDGEADARGEFRVAYAPRTIDDLLALDDGREDEKLFAPVARLSQFGVEAYDLMVRPFVRAMVTPWSADRLIKTQSLRSQRVMFSDRNPVIAGIAPLADKVRATRRPVARDNPFTALERVGAAMIEQSLDLYRDMRDAWWEIMFHAIYGSPVMRRIGEVDLTETREREREQLRQTPEVQAALALTTRGGFAEAVFRMVALFNRAKGGVKQTRLERAALILNTVPPFSGMSDEEQARLVHVQSLIVEFEPELAAASLPSLLPDAPAREKAMALIAEIVGHDHDTSQESHNIVEGLRQRVGLSGAAHATPAPADASTPAGSEAQVPTPDRWSQSTVTTAFTTAAPGQTVPPSAIDIAAALDFARSLPPEDGALSFDDGAVMPRPPRLLTAPAGVRDDLPVIMGIRPDIDATLGGLGVHHFWQIAAWTPAEIAWVNGHLGARGQIQRERWVQQARLLVRAPTAAAAE